MTYYQTVHAVNTHIKDKPDPSNRAGIGMYRIPCECGKLYIGETGRTLPTRLKEHRAHCHRGDHFEKSAILKHSHIKDHQIDWQAAQLITPINIHGIPEVSAIEMFNLFHITSVSTSVIFGDPYYGPKDLLYPKSTTPQTEGSHTSKPTTLPPLVLVNNWLSSVSTHSTPPLPHSPTQRIPVPQFPACTVRFNALILQHPVFE